MAAMVTIIAINGRRCFQVMVFRSIWILLACICTVSVVFCQEGTGDWERLGVRYNRGEISDTAYLNRLPSIADQSFKDSLFKKKLELFKKIAWSKEQYQPYRSKYYSLLANNAAATHKEGAAIYYMQKLELELKKTEPYINSLNEPRFLMAVYGRSERLNFEARKAVFEQVYPFLKRLPSLIAAGNVPAGTCTNAMTILAMASRLYAAAGDTGRVAETVVVAQKIWERLRGHQHIDADKMQQCLYLLNQVQYTAALMNGNFAVAKSLLDTDYGILRSGTAIRPVWARSVERALLGKYIDFFIARGQTDSSRYYLNRLAEKINDNDPGDNTTYLLTAAKVDALENNFKQAYGNLLSAYKISDSLINLKTADINNNLYAQLTAEQKQEEVMQLKEQRQRRGLLIMAASLLAIICMVILIGRLRRKEQRTRKKIEELNRLAQMEIAEMEIKANLVQRKLGMELHDDIAGRLAYLCNYIDRHLLDEADGKERERLQKINELVRDAYQNTRNKSHEWYTEGMKEEQDVFSESVRKLTAYALPDEQYEKQIEIDDASLQQAPHTVRIHLLRIIQEATVNILKHAGASKVALSVYEENQRVMLQISDNGTGFDAGALSKSKGIGLRSIRDVVRHAEGTFAIHSSGRGTELVVAIPV